jgi:NAD(P)-dependent dehydrogenase (short-subunit alcohol dehydrogenase family)
VSKQNIIIFGASGAIGQALCQSFLGKNYAVTAVSRTGIAPDLNLTKAVWLSWDAFGNDGVIPIFDDSLVFNSVVWAQGANCNDNIHTFDLKVHEKLYSVNVTYILVALQCLLRQSLLAPSARLCIISSIWQNLARNNKLSYCTTKSALQGLVQSLMVDLGRTGYLLNAVLPGALDTPMTRANLTEEQIRILKDLTPLGNLPDLNDVCQLVGFLCSQENQGITGQFIAADRGFSYARII